MKPFKLTKRLAALLLPAILALASCTDDTLVKGESGGDSVPEGYIRLTGTVNLPPMIEVQTRSVDPDAKGIETMRLYCFDELGLFTTTVQAEIETQYVDGDDGNQYLLKGTFSADVPEATRTVHIVANQSVDGFRDTDYLGTSEYTVMTSLVATSSNMVYWGRVAAGVGMQGEEGVDPDETLQETFERIKDRKEGNNYIELVRNQARVQFVKDKEGDYTIIDNGNPSENQYLVEGFSVCNTNAFGTIAPYNTATESFDWVTAGEENRNYVTLVNGKDSLTRITVPNEVNNAKQEYVFETRNPIDDPVSVILKGRGQGDAESKYYRVLIQDNEYKTMLIRRDHSYNIHIRGKLSPGYESLSKALEGTPVNNVYLTVDNEITTLNDGSHILSVTPTDSVLLGTATDTEQQTFTFTYTYQKAKDAPAETANVEKGDVKVAWSNVGGGSQNVAQAKFEKEENIDNGVLTGKITLTLLPMGDETQREGTLTVQAGRLMRTVKVITVQQQKFVPTWVSSEVWNGKDESAGQGFTLMFTIPETVPEELFPFDVLVSAPDMDVLSSTGMQLDVITKTSDPERYGKDIAFIDEDKLALGKPIGYKFICPVTAPGVQRIYFRTTFDRMIQDQVTLENPYFETVEHPYSFTDQSRNTIVFLDMAEGNMTDLPGQTGGSDEDAKVKYIIVPRKVNAPVDFTFTVVDYSKEKNSGFDVNLSNFQEKLEDSDEFLLYTSNLKRAPEEGMQHQHFHFSKEQISSLSGTVFGFYPDASTDVDEGHTEHVVHMLTNKPVSEEVVILRSNSSDNSSIKQPTGKYSGNQYRSASFELTNYRAFEFNAALTAENSKVNASEEESQTWTYEYNQPVKVAFDITSFMGGKEEPKQEVDPFGTKFKVYIDAPMLEIDEEWQKEQNIPSNKFYKDNDGRFVYVVDESRDNEASVSSNWSVTTNQSGSDRMERKELQFKTSKIVNAGTITISAEESVVDFTPKTFTITNSPIEGTLSYTNGNGETNYPALLSFISFERTRDNTRIGSVTMGNNGNYTLQLRSEYQYAWGGTEYVVFRYKDASAEYVSERTTLEKLFANPKDIVMTRVQD